MIKLNSFLDNLKGKQFLITDYSGNVIYPSDKKRLEKFNNIINSKTDDGFYKYQDSFYEYSSDVLVEDEKVYIIECLENVTRYKIENLIAKTDIITNLGGQRLTFELFDDFIQNAIELNVPFAAVMGDADHFKSINDTYGHVCGDKMLNSIGKILYENTRHKAFMGRHVNGGSDVTGRIGGEEFLVVLNNLSMINAYNVINKIRRELEKSKLEYDGRSIPLCTMSFGLHYVDFDELQKYKQYSGTVDDIREEILKKCDSALYQSKNTGRNKVSVFNLYDEKILKDTMYHKRLEKKLNQ